MSNLITLDNITLAFGLEPLLDSVKLQIDKGERICLIGRNGAGKSSLLKIIEGTFLPDSGVVWKKPHLRLARLEQTLPLHTSTTVYEFVAEGLADIGKLLSDYQKLTMNLAHDNSEKMFRKLEQLQKEIDVCQGWDIEQGISQILTKLDLPPNVYINEMSGGWQRRAALARALVSSPDLLLLDEPTNHLDINAIAWLEDFLFSSGVSLLFITHDRSLLQRLATRIIELDRGHLTSWPYDYQNYLKYKEEWLLAEEKQNKEFDKKLAEEERWIRQGIKARRTRNEGRVRALKALREKRAERRTVQGKANFSIQDNAKSGKLVIEAENITHHFNHQCVIKNFSLRIMRGDRIGLIGPNGIGKSTLLNILLQQLHPEEGTIRLGTKLQVAYFDQLRKGLNLEKTVAENVVQGTDEIEINGKKRHIISYLGDFLFTPARARTPVKALSGGECNRLLLARLFSQPANLLVMDEPTNDLDIETLELLEELLSQFEGTLLLVSHDREFLDNVVTSTLVFEGDGQIEEYVGGYKDWQNQKEKHLKVFETPKINKDERIKENNSKKLTYKEQKELNELPHQIQKLEDQRGLLETKILAADFYQRHHHSETSKILLEFEEVEATLQTAYKRWEELEKKQ